MKKCKPVLEFHLTIDANLAFILDISQHLNKLNKMLQGCKRLVTQYYDTIGCI